MILTIVFPNRWRYRLNGVKWIFFPGFLFPITTSALPARMGAMREEIIFHGYWLSQSVFTMISAPSMSPCMIPWWNAVPRPRWALNSMIWCIPSSRATSLVLSVLPSLIMRYSISTQVICFGRSWKVWGRVFSSFLQGICMMSLVISRWFFEELSVILLSHLPHALSVSSCSPSLWGYRPRVRQNRPLDQ